MSQFCYRIKMVHIGFNDPLKNADELEDDQAQLDCYRRVRDEIRMFV